MINILIGMPLYRQQVYIQTLASLMGLKEALSSMEIKSSFVYVDSFDVVSARNMISTYFYNNDFTHLLFIDDDMTFSTDDISALLISNEPFIGCICPKREISIERLYDAAREGKSLDAAKAVALDFVVGHRKAESLLVEGNLCQINQIGMAVTLLRRDVFSTMIERKQVETIQFPDDLKEDAFRSRFHYGFFSRIFSEEKHAYLGEDFSFCKRWVDGCAGNIFGLVTANIGHFGFFKFEGRYLDSLQAGRL